MSTAEREKWDNRYRAGAYEGRTHPTALLAEWLPQIPQGRALDVACGAGRNALFLADRGFQVDALDISAVALERARRSAADRELTINWLCADLDGEIEAALPEGSYELIVWVRYVHRTLMPHLVARLAPTGVLVCEQHLTAEGSVAGPSNPAFRLAPGELLRMAAAMQVVHYREGMIEDPDGRTVALAQLVATAR